MVAFSSNVCGVSVIVVDNDDVTEIVLVLEVVLKVEENGLVLPFSHKIEVISMKLRKIDNFILIENNVVFAKVLENHANLQFNNSR